MELVESGIKWLGPIPANWELSKIGHCFEHRNQTVSDKDFEPLSVTKNGVLPQLETAAKSDNSDGRKLIRKGDFVINQRSDRKGSAGVSDRDGSCSVIYTVLEPTKYDPRYAHHLFRSVAFQEEFYRWGTGIVDDLWSTRYSLMKQIACPVPPLEEQTAIADFLDRELNTLDSAIASQEKFVGLLIERRLATIQAAMQESSHRTGSVTAPLKWHAKLRTGGTPSDAQYTAETADGVPWLRPDDLDESGNPSRGTRFFDKTSLAGIGMTTPGSILLCCIGATLGKAGIVQEKVAFNQQITSITSSLNPRFLHYQLVAKKQDLKNLSVGNTLPILNNDRLGTLKIVIPTAENQASIARFLDVQTRSMDIAIQKARDLISVLTERRQALINSAVTGKIDVRGNH